MTFLKMGVIGTSKKEDERRFPIHPEHLSRLPENIRKQLIFEKGYGNSFHISDQEISELTGGIATRSEILRDIGDVIIAKPVLADLEELKTGGIIWGYPHCAQQKEITQIAIDKKLTLIAFEDMYMWSSNGQKRRHTFYKNNEIAGYSAVIHALQLKGIDGHYGNQRKVLIFSFGAVSRGAIYALKAHGYRDITICVQRTDEEVREEVLDVHYNRIRKGKENEARMIVVEHDGSERPLLELINESEIIINGTYQNTDDPIDYVKEEEKGMLKSRTLIIDVSCDEGMGFYFAKPTSFKNPMISIDDIDYYAVDHTPSYYWESSSRSLSAALIPHLPSVVEGRESWKKNKTISNAINVDQGIVLKNSILSFQNRSKEYPHNLLE
ncbi:N(5)-(carboxyethyl)ornithine synthase [Flavobacteriaceae bacterium]|uniref:N(5)-(carboxyethyl)ornithine synthase n=1 Tax=Candidatus Arcticimaribacter forsetii TaxID=2820661 RepID=UPI0020773C50|nr:N(5)-(carboxyethyl)ornithine synthase [Candidatus Arcticimaribacter forsetii]MDB2345497.1 N(5)-(carboxyethyl)ornithine synthase [Flavobacteriaceae bacterium]MDB2457114.1 N(5)-(carboxyethyl)ornithine synthase [Flavobacteriaceae bacterium]MDB4674855.1 N(5)-(carboxyethyl)ornithine synthase [Flavobacteriaceae bacterium]